MFTDKEIDSYLCGIYCGDQLDKLTLQERTKYFYRNNGLKRHTDKSYFVGLVG